MSEWQPAIAITVHPFTEDDPAVFDDDGPCLVRPIDADEIPFAVQQYRRVGCDATKFYQIKGKRNGSIACEHEILTD